MDPYPGDFDIEGSSSIMLELPKARIRRVQTGCLTCKRRKKKCDEIKPRCGDCQRLCLGCSWPPQRQGIERLNSWASESWLGGNPVNELLSDRSQSPQQLTNSPQSTLDLSIADLLCQMSGAISSDVHDANIGDSLQDLSWNISPGSAWLDILTDTPSATESPQENLLNTTLSLYTPSLLPDVTSPHDKALLNHYSTIVAFVLSRHPSTASNPYTSYILPMAISNQLILHCVLALSATHWQKLQPDMRDRALLHKGHAAQSLANLLPHVDSNSVDIALVACLLLCMSELFDGTSAGWKLHLQGAKRLLSTLQTQNSANLSSGHFKFFVKLARFLDSAATTSTCKPPLIDDSTVKALPESTEHSSADDAAIYGIPKELFHMVDRVNNLASKRGTRVDERSEALFRQEAERVQGLLDSWAYDYGGLTGAVNSLCPENDDVLYATIAYEWALRLRLHQITEGYSTDEKVFDCVQHILDSAQKIRYGSSLESCLLFPLVMAGGACSTLEQRMVVQDRLMVIERTCGFGYVHQSRELVETVWKRRETESMVNWARIRYEEMGGLALY
ncbi:hypothetical protein FCULG_00012939 [Fusarium culmorum]|uniref:Zn(2)-C6 fungal-type domain-containing protein n=1 Tax=Fusarium culmorum TaxID=5516 RepID=A0A2T4GF28_FUSCU|nr:hypothetical protein FCULG_00012939 [Fusarium culmorum]